MDPSLTSETLQAFLHAVGTRHPQPATLYLLGGSALRLLGSPRATLDVDYLGSDRPPLAGTVEATLQAVASEMHIEVEGVPLAEFIPLPPDSDARHQLVGQFGKLTVYVFDPYSLALSKIERGFESDLEDVRFLFVTGYLTWELLECYAAQLLQQAPAFLIDPQAFRRHLDILRRLA